MKFGKVTIEKKDIVYPMKTTKKGNDMLIINTSIGRVYAFGYHARIIAGMRDDGKIILKYKNDGKWISVKDFTFA